MTTKKTSRIARADERIAARAKLTPKQQLQALDERLGVGKGAERERTRLQALIEKEAQQVAVAVEKAKVKAEKKAPKAKKPKKAVEA